MRRRPGLLPTYTLLCATALLTSAAEADTAAVGVDPHALDLARRDVNALDATTADRNRSVAHDDERAVRRLKSNRVGRERIPSIETGGEPVVQFREVAAHCRAGLRR